MLKRIGVQSKSLLSRLGGFSLLGVGISFKAPEPDRVIVRDIITALAHVPAKWNPVRRQGHAPTPESTAFSVHMGSPSDPI